MDTMAKYANVVPKWLIEKLSTEATKGVVQPAYAPALKRKYAPCQNTCPYIPDQRPDIDNLPCGHQKAAVPAFKALELIAKKIQSKEVLDNFCKELFSQYTASLNTSQSLKIPMMPGGGKEGVEHVKKSFKNKQMKTSVKQRNRSVFKIASKYKGNPIKLGDICRISVIFPDVKSLYKGLDELIRKAGKNSYKGIGPIVRMKDRFLNAPVPDEDAKKHGIPAAQYRDLQVLLRMDSPTIGAPGFLVEVQLHLFDMFAVKEMAVHDFYKQYRGLSTKGSTVNPRIMKLINLSNIMLNNRFESDIKPELKPYL